MIAALKAIFSKEPTLPTLNVPYSHGYNLRPRVPKNYAEDYKIDEEVAISM
jgi:hypothetical protein